MRCAGHLRAALLGLLVFGLGGGAGHAEPASSVPAAVADASLVAPTGFASSALWTEAVAAHVDRLVATAEQADRPARERARAALAAANLLLGCSIEPACTRQLLRLSVPQPAADARRAVTRAVELLDRAEQLVGDQDPPTPELWTTLGVLRAFAGGMQALLRGPDDVAEPVDAGRADRQAASRLAVLMEHDDARVAAAAQLWHAVLRGPHESPERALRLLRPVLEPPARGTMPAALFARLLACRLHAEHEGPAAALALLYQLEERCLDWLDHPDDHDAALRTIAVVELDVLRTWREKLDEPGSEAERDWCDRKIRELMGERFAGSATDLYRLQWAVPILLPEAEIAVPDAG